LKRTTQEGVMAYFKVTTVPAFAWRGGDEAHNLRTVDIEPVTFQTPVRKVTTGPDTLGIGVD